MIKDNNEGSSSRKFGECRICHEEDEDSNMEVPCSCRGTLKYAHRKCVQRWCNEKGDTICEICLRLLGPDYTAPPPSQFYHDGIPLNLRVSWDNPQISSAIFSTSWTSLDSEFDEYPVLNSKSLICCRIVAMIFCTLLVIRHSLPFVIYGISEHASSSPSSLIMLLMLRTIAIVLPIYVVAKALTAVLRRRSLQPPIIAHETFYDEENEFRHRGREPRSRPV